MKKVYDLKGKEIDVIQVVPSKNYIYLPLGYIGLIESDNPELKVIFFTTDFLEWAKCRFKKKPPYSIRKDITWLKVKQWNALIRRIASGKDFQLPLVRKYLPIKKEVFEAFVYPENSEYFLDKQVFRERMILIAPYMYMGDYIRVKNEIPFTHKMFNTIGNFYCNRIHLDILNQWKLPATVIGWLAYHVWDTFVFELKHSCFIGGLSEEEFQLIHKYLCGELSKTQMNLIKASLVEGE